jgi:hypothetical protein
VLVTNARFPAVLAASVVTTLALILVAAPSAMAQDAVPLLQPGNIAPAWTLPSPDGAPARFPDAASGGRR